MHSGANTWALGFSSRVPLPVRLKYIQVPKWEKAKFGIGAQFYNVFNHPNYDLPIANASKTGSFGQIVRTVSGPTSPFGSVLGADASPRLIQLKAQFTF
jgi:hypothetical protein